MQKHYKGVKRRDFAGCDGREVNCKTCLFPRVGNGLRPAKEMRFGRKRWFSLDAFCSERLENISCSETLGMLKILDKSVKEAEMLLGLGWGFLLRKVMRKKKLSRSKVMPEARDNVSNASAKWSAQGLLPQALLTAHYVSRTGLSRKGINRLSEKNVKQTVGISPRTYQALPPVRLQNPSNIISYCQYTSASHPHTKEPQFNHGMSLTFSQPQCHQVQIPCLHAIVEIMRNLSCLLTLDPEGSA